MDIRFLAVAFPGVSVSRAHGRLCVLPGFSFQIPAHRSVAQPCPPEPPSAVRTGGLDAHGQDGCCFRQGSMDAYREREGRKESGRRLPGLPQSAHRHRPIGTAEDNFRAAGYPTLQPRLGCHTTGFDDNGPFVERFNHGYVQNSDPLLPVLTSGSERRDDVYLR
jgi:hypothetical protein